MNKRRIFLVAVFLLLVVLLAGCAEDRAPTELAADFTLPDNKGNMMNLEDELAENEQVVLVFYYD